MTRAHRNLAIDTGATAEEAPARARSLAGLFLPVVALALGACTVVRVSEGSSVRTKYYPGVAVVRVAPGSAAQLVDVRAIGPAIVGNQASLGWLDSQIALVPQGRCHLILWRPSRATVEEIRTLFGAGTELCTPAGESK